jgi:hypothetical protein
MPRAAVAVATAGDAVAGTRSRANPGLEQVGPRRKLRPGRSHFLLLLVAALAVWLVVVFGRALTDVNEATQRQQVLTAESQALTQRLEAGRHELELVQTDAFQRLQARSFGMGESGELVFSLQPGTPDAPPIARLGGTGAALSALSPLDAWLELLFGD